MNFPITLTLVEPYIYIYIYIYIRIEQINSIPSSRITSCMLSCAIPEFNLKHSITTYYSEFLAEFSKLSKIITDMTVHEIK